MGSKDVPAWGERTSLKRGEKAKKTLKIALKKIFVDK